MGRGNARLIAWEGERTITFTMEDALISPEGFMILSGAGLVDASSTKPIYQHITETIDSKFAFVGDEDTATIDILVSNKPYLSSKAGDGDLCYVMFVEDGEVKTEPYIATDYQPLATGNKYLEEGYVGYITVKDIVAGDDAYKYRGNKPYKVADDPLADGFTFDSVIVDYYVEKTSGAKQIEITADKFGGNYYLEASTLFRTEDGVDLPAEFIIPNCKVQSNFTFTMASSGDPSTFTFTMDAFPDYTRFDHSQKVFATVQVIEDSADSAEAIREQTNA